ncbi:MAG: elongation factor P hydroxylase [Pseudomonadales bacterium]
MGKFDNRSSDGGSGGGCAARALNDRDISARFNSGPGLRHHARLEGGAPEPLYQPAAGVQPARIIYRLDYAQSALHELAHWCIAGYERRLLPDYGYWYVPPPRTASQRACFFQVESRVQGLELLLAELAGVRFHVSLDDPGADAADFGDRVAQASAAWRKAQLPPRTIEVMAAIDRDWRLRLGRQSP